MDLKPIGSTNHNTKYMDDASLFKDDKLLVNMVKTKELEFHQQNVRNYLPPAELLDIERVLCAKLLGV